MKKLLYVLFASAVFFSVFACSTAVLSPQDQAIYNNLDAKGKAAVDKETDPDKKSAILKKAKEAADKEAADKEATDKEATDKVATPATPAAT